MALVGNPNLRGVLPSPWHFADPSALVSRRPFGPNRLARTRTRVAWFSHPCCNMSCLYFPTYSTRGLFEVSPFISREKRSFTRNTGERERERKRVGGRRESKGGSLRERDGERERDMGKLRVFVDHLSEPSRAVLIFCLVNNIDMDVQLVDVMKGEHKKPEFKAVNPMGLVPAIDDGGFLLFESHAILRYLALAYPNIPDHWYPLEVRKRAQIECILDWHHTTLRRGAAGMVRNLLAPAALNIRVGLEAEAVLKSSLLMMENTWLQGDGSFLTGSSQPSIADLSLACQAKQLQFLGEDKASALLDPVPKVKNWLHAVEKATAPHFAQVHETMINFASRFREDMKKQVDLPSDANENTL